MAEELYVGRVHYIAEPEFLVCARCSARIPRKDAASHARGKHRHLADGVVAGQLGLPFTKTPDVPG